MKNQSRSRIETKPSQTASIMCMARAVAYKDKRECFNGPDDIAYLMVPPFLRLLIKSRYLFKPFSRLLFAKGLLEYVNARTKYMDAAFVEALKEGFAQVVIFGAGFDSRALRFNELNLGTTVFELDAPLTQRQKQEAYRKKKLTAPGSLVFVPIDFNKETLQNKLSQAGFASGKKTLYLLEGVTMYLPPQAIEGTFRFIADSAGDGSMAVFDYIYAGVLRGESRYYGEEGMAEKAKKVGETWLFGLEEDEAERFLGRYRFTLRDNSGAAQLEERFFKDSMGEIVGKINGTHAICTGVKT
jgi:methyltransferase (TIGR00027 family)